MKNKELIQKLMEERNLTNEELNQLLTALTDDTNSEKSVEQEYLFAAARKVREEYYGKDVYVRGLIEFSNICKNDCYYCGLRKSNKKVERYRLTPEEILCCAKEGYQLGLRTFVLQSGEDSWYTKERMAQIVRNIKEEFPECAITLSVGERECEEYQCWREAGADRYLLRHETAVDEHYQKLHPESLSLAHRKKCLLDLRELGYQVGAGMMIGSPGQTIKCLVEDIRFLQNLKPHMIGMGPFLPHEHTPFGNEPNGSYELSLVMLAITRLLFPKVLLPATTALGTIVSNGREQGLLAGANVLMPNLSPIKVREKYELYNNKAHAGRESAQCMDEIGKMVEAIGYRVVIDRGDSRV